MLGGARICTCNTWADCHRCAVFFKLVIFNIVNADFDLAAWVRDFDLTGDAVE
jgi:hypothetical protein